MSTAEWIGFAAEGLAGVNAVYWVRSSYLAGRDGVVSWIAPLSWVHTLILVTFAALSLPPGLGRILVPANLVLIGLQIWLVRAAWRRGAMRSRTDNPAS